MALAGQTTRELPRFRSAIDLTTVTATVLGPDGHLITKLPKEAFEVYEDGELQTVTQFTNERVPVGVAILLDVSDSMYGSRIADARTAVESFADRLVQLDDEFSIVVFNHRQRVLAEWTTDAAAARRALEPVKPTGSTAIYDAIIGVLPLMETRTRQRAAVLMISDGADTASDAALGDVRTQLLRSDAFVYAIAIDAAGRRPINAPISASALREITDQSGGTTHVVHSSAEIGAALEEVAQELSSQYLIGYSSPKGADGRFHTIRVRVTNTEYRVRARRGYVAELRR